MVKSPCAVSQRCPYPSVCLQDVAPLQQYFYGFFGCLPKVSMKQVSVYWFLALGGSNGSHRQILITLPGSQK